MDMFVAGLDAGLLVLPRNGLIDADLVTVLMILLCNDLDNTAVDAGLSH